MFGIFQYRFLKLTVVSAAAFQSSGTPLTKAEAVKEARKEETRIWNSASTKARYYPLSQVHSLTNHRKNTKAS